MMLSSLSMMIQIITLTMYHGRHKTGVPQWLKTATRCLKCHTTKSVKSNKTDPHGISDGTTLECESEVDLGMKCDPKDNTENGIVQEMSKITKSLQDKEVEESVQEEWKDVVEVLDKFLFGVFIVVQTTMILVAFVFIPFT